MAAAGFFSDQIKELFCDLIEKAPFFVFEVISFKIPTALFRPLVETVSKLRLSDLFF